MNARLTEDELPLELGTLEANHAWLLMRLGADDDGLRMSRRALGRLGALGPAALPAVRTALHARGAIFDVLGRFEDASEHFRRALELADHDSPDAAASLVNLGITADLRGDHASAEGCLRQALALYARHHRIEGQIETSGALAWVLLHDDRAMDAKFELEARSSLVANDGPDLPRLRWLLTLAEVEYRLSRPDQAANVLHRTDALGVGTDVERVARADLEARLAATRGALDAAEAHAIDALTVACEHHNLRNVVNSLITLLEVRGLGGHADPRDRSLAGAVAALLEEPNISADVRWRAREMFALRSDLKGATEPPWLSTAIEEPRMFVQRAQLAH